MVFLLVFILVLLFRLLGSFEFRYEDSFFCFFSVLVSRARISLLVVICEGV